ncbi:MAG: hypothetical protein GY710_13665 [Desulfobacteraceae bacterium]|nr:hypothetical protein [Desulfobacteraceae bacterium]
MDTVEKNLAVISPHGVSGILVVTKKFVKLWGLVFFFCGVFVFFPSISSALAVETEFKAFTDLLFTLQDRLVNQDRSQNFAYDAIFSHACDFPEDAGEEVRIIREQRDLVGRDKGLEFRGALSSGSFSGGDEDDDSSFEKGRGNIELSWDLLKNGYLQQLSKTKTLDLLIRETQILVGQRELERQFRCRYLGIKKDFAGLRMKLLELKLKLLKPVFQIERRAYFKQWSFLDDYLVSEQDLVLTRQELDVFHADPYFDGEVFHWALPPIIAVDFPELLELIRGDDSQKELLQMQKKRLQKEQESVFHNSLRVYLRKDFDTDEDLGNTDDVVAGLRFRVPLYSRKTDLVNLKVSQLEQQKDYALWERLSLCRAAQDALQEQLRRTIKQFYRQERARERVRQTLILMQKGNESLVTTAITRMKTMIDARLELIAALEELYRRVSMIFLVAQVPYHSDLVKTVSVEPALNRARPGKRSIYIWSKSFNLLDNQDIITFLEAKQISSVLLSDSRHIDPGKRDDFIEQALQKQIQTQLIIGDNTWIFEKKHGRAVEKSLIAAEKTGAIHFDIEPQTMDGYHENREVYLGLFLDLVRKIKLGLLDRHFSVAVPFSWSEKTYRELGLSAGKLFIMAYGTRDPDVLVRRITPALRAVGPKKLVVVLRTSDFKDEWEMEKMIEQILAKTGIDAFCFQDLGGFLTFSGSAHETEN